MTRPISLARTPRSLALAALIAVSSIAGSARADLVLEPWQSAPVSKADDLVALDGTAWIAGGEGVVRLDLDTGDMVLLHPNGDAPIAAIALAPGNPNIVAAASPNTRTSENALYISRDRGMTWSESAVPDRSTAALRRRSILFAPGPEAQGAGLLFVNTGCNGLAMSDDLGDTWTTLAPSSDICVETPIGLSGNGRILWLGTELVLDSIAIWTRDISARSNTPPGPWDVLIEGQNRLGNHDPNTIVADPSDPEAVYIGAELSLMHVTSDGDLDYRIGSARSENWPYFRAVYIDVDDFTHVLAGGAPNGFGPQLYESFDSGRSPAMVELPGTAGARGMVNGIVPVSGTRDVVVLVWLFDQGGTPGGPVRLFRGTFMP